MNTGDNAYYTMKQVRGETLKAILKKLEKGNESYLKKYPFQRLLEIFLKTCDAMALAHEKGVIHRDLKPENIMVGDFGEVLVIDWGLARRIDQDDINVGNNDTPNDDPDDPLVLVTQAGAVMGTPGYMSPEQVRGHNVGTQSDVFALGAVLYTMLTFQPPAKGANLREFIVNLLRGHIIPPEDI